MTMDQVVEITEKMNELFESYSIKINKDNPPTIEDLEKRIFWIEKYNREITTLNLELLKMIMTDNTMIKDIKNQISELTKTQNRMLETDAKLIALLQIGDDTNARN